jgi:hypothetical protein
MMVVAASRGRWFVTLSHESQSGDKSGGEKRTLQYIRITSPKAVQDAQSAVGNDLIY